MFNINILKINMIKITLDSTKEDFKLLLTYNWILVSWIQTIFKVSN